jgi:DNA-binding NarL/FixJ family response regulator
VRLVRAGGVFVPASSLVAARRTTDAGNGAARSTGGIFTARQAAVVDALRRGKANKVIAYELKMRESTVKVHVRNIMKRLKAQNRTQVAYLVGQLRKDAQSA